MCGIVGYYGSCDAQEVVMSGLKKLEYRGYDSAGIAILNKENKMEIFKDKGRVDNLAKEITIDYPTTLAIGHTRWATHGEPSKNNAHPHQSESGRIIIVHNGVIENYKRLRSEYLPEDIKLKSSTDTEIIANLIQVFADKYEIEVAIKKAASLLEGSYALIIVDTKDTNKIYVVKNKTPMVIGVSDKGTTIASDVIPLVGYADKYVVLQDKTFGVVEKNSVHLFDNLDNGIQPEYKELDLSNDEIEKGNFPHYMLKEIHEQPGVIRRLVQEYFDGEKLKISDGIINTIKNCNKINLVASGTSMYASYMAKYYFEKLCSIRTEVFCASELVYSTPLILDSPCFIFISQSGETADSIAVMKKFKTKYPCITITNTTTSTMASMANYYLDIYAGKEIAVASTKAYIAQVVVCAILAKAVSGQSTKLKNNLSRAALAIEKILQDKIVIKNLAKSIVDARDVFYIGRGIDYWASLEAALKLKEISYIHTEAFSSGELKHGTIALIEKGTPVIAICTQEGTNSIIRSNLEETISRGAKGIVISMESMSESQDDIVIPNVAHYLTPIVSVVVCQLLAYYASTLRGNDVDKPKNLAKSVTVE